MPDSKKVIKLTLLVIALGGFFLIYFLFNPSQHSFFIPCPFHYMTGYHCPGCGSQRALHQLLHGDVIAAFWLNPFMVLTLPILMYALGLRVWNYMFETQYRVWFFYNKLFIYGYFGLAILYWVVRNLPYYPFSLLSPTESP